jgi:hypothetical protein
VIIDADFFNGDNSFFDLVGQKLEDDTFAGGWVWRNLDTASYKGQQAMPMGTELLILKPLLYLKMNCQRFNHDLKTLKILRREFPGITYAREYVDTFYGPCWKAQFSGYKIDDRFSGLNVCHVGGHSHIKSSYFEVCPPDTDRAEWMRVWIRRARLNLRVVDLFRQQKIETLLPTSRLAEFEGLREVAHGKPELKELWDTLDESSDEKGLNAVLKLF